MKNYAEIMFVDKVRKRQEAVGMADKYLAAYPERTEDVLIPEIKEFIEQRISFYIASVSASGWPYVQHRGGPRGFLKVTGPTQLGFADYVGNRQFITAGHADHDNRVALILVDYENRIRYKVLGRLTLTPISDAAPSLAEQLSVPGQGFVERIATIDVEAMDRNCRQHIPRLVELERLEALQAENEQLRLELAKRK